MTERARSSADNMVPPRHSSEIVIEEMRPDDAAACADILNEWIDTEPWLPRAQSRESALPFCRDILPASRKVLVARINDALVGFLACGPGGDIDVLNVAVCARGRGVGSALVGQVMAAHRNLTLRTFVANTRARAFYERHGFMVIGGTEDDNDEKIPDYIMTWSAD